MAMCAEFKTIWYPRNTIEADLIGEEFSGRGILFYITNKELCAASALLAIGSDTMEVRVAESDYDHAKELIAQMSWALS